MDDALILLAAPLFVVLVVVVRLFAGSLNHARIDAYIRDHGGRVERIEWAPFGKGWFGEKSQAIYRVTYADHAGNRHEASCKTSLFTGVYWTEDRLIAGSRRPPYEPESEVERLRRENTRLRRRLRGSEED